MSTAGATWADYGSLIQLGAGLNFAYAGLEVILNKPLGDLRARQQAALQATRQRMRERSAGRTGEGRSNAFRSAQAADALGVAGAVEAWITRLNPYLATLCGCAATVVLGYGAEHAGVPMGLGWRVAAWSIGFGWFFASLGAMATCRMLLAALAAPALRES